MKRILFICVFFCLMGLTTRAQRHVDKLDRSLVAVKVNGGVYCSWRILGEEYYDVTYNIYRDGTKLNDKPLTVSNYTDAGGTASSVYTVEPVVRGMAKAKSKGAKPMSNGYLEIRPDHGNLSGTFVPNDATAADLDGDGELELIVKFDHANTGDDTYTVIEAYKLDGTKLWWINCGRNMGDFQNNEINIAAYDWDLDGRAECIMRAADGTVIHMADGTTQTIGDPSKNYRPTEDGQWFVHDGAEYLLYLDGLTAKPYQVMPYPLKRLEPGESSLTTAWGDGYGHRSSKYFFGAPYFDGKKPSIFLARGIYTRHKMIAYDVNPADHSLTTRWTWNCNTPGSIWYGQGYHNYIVADVDWDGRDEIVFGSMTIDDNGRGLASTGLGHGDAQHVSDFDPYRHGQEFFGCNEDRPGNNLCDATTRKILYRYSCGNDDGRGIMGNFSNDYPGCQGVSARDPGLISSVTYKTLDGGSKSDIAQNMNIYWDGDLCEESFNGSGSHDTEGVILKYGTGRIANLAGSLTNNYTKATPCLMADLFGDWREEVVMRTADNNIRIYTSTIATKWRNYTLWHDHQYRNAIVWQMNGYNQPPHVSYFLGELEGITVAPPPLTTTGRTVIANGSSIGSDCNDKHVMLDETGDMTVNVTDGASPYILTDNAPTWVQGRDNAANIVTTSYTHTLTGGALTGAMRLVKQGDGTLVMPAASHTYTGSTDIWAGTLRLDGSLENSRLWLNRHTTLISNGGKFMKGIQADYNSTIVPGGQGTIGSLTADSLILNFGSAVAIDLNAADRTADCINAKTLTVEKKNWANGPTYSTPVFHVNLIMQSDNVADGEGKYLIGEVGKLDGNLDDILIEGVTSYKSALSLEDGKLYLTLTAFHAGTVSWIGAEDAVWSTDGSANFESADGSGVRGFVPDDEVIFDDNAVLTDVTISGKVKPSSIVFNNAKKTFSISGDSIVGNPTLTVNGTGTVIINNENRIGSTSINNGKLSVRTLANNAGTDFGALGGVTSAINISGGATLSVQESNTTSQTINVGEGGANLDVVSGTTLTMSTGIKQSVSGQTLTKLGEGALTLGSGNSVSKLVIRTGSVNTIESNGLIQLPSIVTFEGGTLYDSNSEGSYTTNSTNFVVENGQTGAIYCDPRCEYTGNFSGAGRLTFYAAGVRNYINGDWNNFTGTLIPALSKRGTYDPVFYFTSTKGLVNATLVLNTGMTINNDGKNIPLGTVTGTGTLAGSGSYYVGDKDNDFTFGAYSTSKIVKRGTGTMKIISLGRITAPVEVQAGTLSFNNSSLATLVNGSNAMTVSGTGVVLGQGLIHSLTVNSGGSLYPRASYDMNNPGIIKANGALTVANGATVGLVIGSSKCSQLQAKFITINGTLKVSLADNFVPKVGTEYTLWTASSSFGGTPTLELQDLPAGFAWDTTGLLSATGVIKIAEGSGISSVSSAEEVACEVYSLTGQKLGTFTAQRSEIRSRLASYNINMNARTFIIKMRTAGGTEVKKMSVK